MLLPQIAAQCQPQCTRGILNHGSEGFQRYRSIPGSIYSASCFLRSFVHLKLGTSNIFAAIPSSSTDVLAYSLSRGIVVKVVSRHQQMIVNFPLLLCRIQLNTSCVICRINYPFSNRGAISAFYGVCLRDVPPLENEADGSPMLRVEEDDAKAWSRVRRRSRRAKRKRC